MNTKHLLEHLAHTVKSYMNRAFIALFLMMLIESVGTLFFVGPAVYLLTDTNPPYTTIVLSYALFACGIFVWFLLQSGFSVMMLRMARNQYVSIGFLFLGFRKITQFAPPALFYTSIIFIIAGLVRAINFVLLKNDFDLLAYGNSLVEGIGGLLLVLGMSVFLLIVFMIYFSFLFQIRSESDTWGKKNIFLQACISFKIMRGNVWRFISFLFRACARNVTLAVFYIAAKFFISGSSENSFMKLIDFLFDFFYLINLYKAMIIFHLAVPVFYVEAITPSLEIIIPSSLEADKNSDSSLLQ